MVPYKDLFIQLEKSGIQYLVAGGFAVNFHQVQRATVDLDLIVHLEKSNILNFIALMKTLGFEPKIPVKTEQLADPAIRKQWITEKGLMVFSFFHPKNSYETVDVFVDEPKPFLELYSRKLSVKAFGSIITVLGKNDLIEMKKSAGRDRDLYDVSQLEKTK